MAGGDPVPIDPRQLMKNSKSLVGGDLWDYLEDGVARRDRAARLFAAFEKGVVLIPDVETFALSEGASAHRRLEDRGFAGKIVMIPDL